MIVIFNAKSAAHFFFFFPLLLALSSSATYAMTRDDTNELVEMCVSHLRDHAQHYLSLIRSKQTDGVLWAVFRAVPRTSPLDRPIELSKASFLALSSMASSKADVLLRMQREVDATRQFVCWFTLDDGFGAPLASKVLIIDAGDVEETAEVHPTAGKHTSAQLSSNPDAHSRKRAESPKSVRDLIAAVAASQSSAKVASSKTPIRSTGHHVELPEAGAATSRSTAGSSVDVTGSPAMLMKMVMQVADSVASMGSAMDMLTARCCQIEKDMSLLGRRVHDLEMPVFGLDYDYRVEYASSTAPEPSNSGDLATNNSGIAAARTPKASATSNVKGRNKVLTTNADLMMQITEVSLRLGETENRVRVLESQSQNVERLRQLVFQQVEGVKQHVAHLANRSTDSGRAEMEESMSYPWRKPPQELGNSKQGPALSPSGPSSRQQRGVTALTFPPSAKLLDSPPHQQTNDHRKINFSSAAEEGTRSSSVSPWRQAMTRGSDVSAGPGHSGGDVSTFEQPRSSSNASSTPRPGALTDMIQALEVKLGGIRQRHR